MFFIVIWWYESRHDHLYRYHCIIKKPRWSKRRNLLNNGDSRTLHSQMQYGNPTLFPTKSMILGTTSPTNASYCCALSECSQTSHHLWSRQIRRPGFGDDSTEWWHCRRYPISQLCGCVSNNARFAPPSSTFNMGDFSMTLMQKASIILFVAPRSATIVQTCEE